MLQSIDFSLFRIESKCEIIVLDMRTMEQSYDDLHALGKLKQKVVDNLPFKLWITFICLLKLVDKFYPTVLWINHVA